MENPAYGFVVTLPAPLDVARERVEAALKAEGFGVLTEIDVKATLKKKIDVDFAPYLILGACNPKLAYRALSIQPNIGLLLPCNVTLHEIDGATRVSIVDPLQMLGMESDNADLHAVATEAEAAFRRVEQALAG
ncbi:MAG: DUF302 domain-containing protein [Thermomicrobiales bacterium]|nr:DUF302 domain-containing protein [Thermomicrobiales bacterium]MCO5219554.1 DUF302 domain-containing protein [Thermomicrobiales bacterium]MCO5228358.1 DUF302 domain-containing protein [Thermomicrobiales bacterium]